MMGFNVRLWQRFMDIARPYWVSDERWRARGMVALLVGLLLAQTWFNVLFNQQTGEFTSALAARDADRFWQSIRACVVLLLAVVPVLDPHAARLRHSRPVATVAATWIVFGRS